MGLASLDIYCANLPDRIDYDAPVENDNDIPNIRKQSSDVTSIG